MNNRVDVGETMTDEIMDRRRREEKEKEKEEDKENEICIEVKIHPRISSQECCTKFASK